MSSHWLGRCIWLLTLGVLVGSCASAQSKAIREYRQGNCARAMVQFERACDNDGCKTSSNAAYVLYRGLTHFCLGDEQASRYWLGRAKHFLDTDVNTYTDEQRGSLLSACRSMGHHPGTAASDIW